MTSKAPLVLPSVTTIPQVRFSDTDALGHISSMSYAAWGEVGRGDFFAALGESDVPWFVLVHLELDFHAEGRFGDAFELSTRAVRLGGKSLTIEHVVTVAGRKLCTMGVVMACFDRETRKAIALPAHWRLPD